jgi:hypothetical protein
MSGTGGIGIMITILIVIIVVFLILREFWCWYWKINKMSASLQTIEKKMGRLVDLMEGGASVEIATPKVMVDSQPAIQEKPEPISTPEKKTWKCTCGTVNDYEVMNCTKCSKFRIKS